MHLITLSPFVRFDLNFSKRQIVVLNLNDHRAFDLTSSEILLLAAALRAVSSSDLLAKTAAVTGEDEASLSQRLLSLMSYGLLQWVDGSEYHDQRSLISLRDEWVKRGWDSSFDYVLSTMNMVFHGGDQEGLAKASEIMMRYAAVEPDIDRGKQLSSTSQTVALPTIDDLVSKSHEAGSWSHKERILAILSCVAAPVRTSVPPWGGEALHRKLHPSGGARHPTEAYLLLPASLGDVSEGTYHVQALPPKLAKMASAPWSSNPGLVEPLANRVPFPISACILLTSKFSRNRYRYRESRTYRTVHMDIGHIISNIEEISEALGIPIFVTYTWDSQFSELITGVPFIDEGALATVFFGS